MYKDSIELTAGVNGGEAVIMTFTSDEICVAEEGYVVTEIQLSSYGSSAKISFGGLTPSTLRKAADKLEELMKGE